MKEYAKRFYNSREWKTVRTLYIKKVDGLCERCLSSGVYTPGKIVHHKIHLTPKNIKDPRIALNFGNLELLCQTCHTREHEKDIRPNGREYEERYVFKEDGSIAPLSEKD